MADGVTGALPPVAVRRRPRWRARGWVGPRSGLALLGLASATTLALVDDDSRSLVLPLLALVNLAGLHVAVLWRRDREIPVFEIGTVLVAATVLYSTIPFVNFIVDGGRWGPASDARIAQYPVDVDRLVAFAWRYVAYLASFVAVYLPLRARRSAGGARLDPVPPSMLAALLVVLGLKSGFELLLGLTYGLDVSVSYTDLQPIVRPPDMPYVLWQVTLIVVASTFVVKQALLLLLIRQWNDLRWRLIVLVWLAGEVLGVAVQMGSRGTAVRLLLTFVLLYHRFVRPLRALALLTGGIVLLAGFLAQGILRFRPGLEDGLDLRTLLTSDNEFQAVFATAYDLFQRRAAGTLPDVPWQIYVSDLYLVIPSQVLPFEKWDPSEWYLEVIGARGTGVGYMFGVMAQAVLGFDWIELVARGALLGLLAALLHRWYVRRARRFWPTAFYAFVGIWSYYTVRATSFYLVHFVVYQFVSVMVVVALLNVALWRRRRPRPVA